MKCYSKKEITPKRFYNLIDNIVSLSVPNAIMNYKLSLTTNALHVMLRDIREYRDLHEKIGMDCDDESWCNFEQWLEQEIKLRKINNTEKAS